ncbi:MAG: hypothetical protein IKC71_00605 [Clostridia bacterium]|nr:hypothetical protein [Clostridia bacterium]
MKLTSRIIALSGISAAFSAIFLILGAFIEVVDIPCAIVASLFVVLPLYYKSYWGSILAFLVGGGIALIINPNFISLVYPFYFGFFGIFAIVKWRMLQKEFNRIWGFIIGLIWFMLVMGGIYYYYFVFLGQLESESLGIISEYFVYIWLGVGLIFYLIYDKLIVKLFLLIINTLRRIIK